jgi:hypothetical protein
MMPTGQPDVIFENIRGNYEISGLVAVDADI